MRSTLPLCLVLFGIANYSYACNTPDELAWDLAFSNSHDGQGGLPDQQWDTAAAPLSLLPQTAGDESPACLDGSPYGFYFRPSPTNSKRWTISISGGGWCYDEAGCFSRSKMALGTSTKWANASGCNCMNVNEDGTLDRDCNCLYMPYGDGASFSGFRAKPWPVPPTVRGAGNNSVLYFRGIKNFDATMDWAFEHGLKDAEEFVLTGGSAGGLSTFLHADRINSRLIKEAPQIKRVTAAPVVGYFLDHADYAKDDQSYTDWMKYIYHMQNLTFGSDGGLMETCQKAFPQSPHYCFMSPHMQQFIETPFFMFNSKYDAWQLGNELRTPDKNWVKKPEQAAVLQYGQDFLRDYKPVTENKQNGAMITSCICHGCSWDTLEVAGKNSYQHYASWFFNVSSQSNFWVDTAGPNGDGTFKDPRCAPFPKQMSD